MSVRRALSAFVLCVAFVGSACILGPKQDDPSSVTTIPGPGDSGFGVDSALGDAAIDSRGGVTDAAHESTPTTDTSASDAPGDTAPPTDGDAGDAPPFDTGEDASEGSTSDGGAPADGGVE